MVTRKENWPSLLSGYLQEHRRKPFSWAENDCMSFVSKCVERLTGHDFLKDYPAYHDEESAKAVLEEHGGIVEIITACLGRGHRNILQAKRGDVVIVKTPEIAGGVVDDSGQSISLLSKEGLTTYPLKRAWRVWSY